MARYPDATWYPSPNFSERGPYEVRLWVEHISGEGTLAGMRGWFQHSTGANAVSAHFGIGKDGTVDQYVNTAFAAWHAGIVNKPDSRIGLIPGMPLGTFVNPNKYSIGVEWEGVPGQPLTEGQIEAGIKLHLWLDKVHPLFRIDRQHIVGHYQINSVDRANDPGSAFPWDRLLAALKGDDMTFSDKDKADLINARNVVRGFAALLKTAHDSFPLLVNVEPGKQLTGASETLDRILGGLQ